MRDIPRITVTDRRIVVRLAENTHSLPSRKLPSSLASWLRLGRLAVYRQLLEDPDRIEFFHQHLPVLVTRPPDSPFPFNCGNKGVGFLPDEQNLDRYIALYRRTIEATRGMPWRQSLAQRLTAARAFHEDTAAIDQRCLTSIEIFQRQTYANLRDYPFASLLFTGSSPQYMSFQLNCAVEIIDEQDPRFAFIKLSRRMFEFDGFHIAQPDFHTGYLFWISEVLDKTPHRVADRIADAGADGETPDLPWDDEALAVLLTLPAWSRAHVKVQIDRYGLERGFCRITAAVVAEARTMLRH
ncbi:MAG: PCP reductase family protein [Thermodesulfobacteriota bacterium]